MSAKDIKIRGIRSPVPTGHVLGRVSPGIGDVEVIHITDLAGQLAATGSLATPGGVSPLAPLANDKIWVGNASSVATPVSVSGDATMDNTGVVTLANTAVAAGSYTVTNLTVNSKGLITAASSNTAPTFTNVTDSALSAGYVVYASTGGLLKTQLGGLSYDDVNVRLGVFTATPLFNLDIRGTSQFGASLSSSAGVRFENNGAAGALFGINADNNAYNDLQIFTGGSASITSKAGTLNVLIGTGTDTGAKLSVNGAVGLMGATSGTINLQAAAIAGTHTITLPAGTTDFSATGGANQFVAQSSAGAAFTVGTVDAGGLSGTTLKSTVVTSSLTAVGTLVTGVWNATKIALGFGGTGSDLSATGGTNQFLKQASAGAAITVARVGAIVGTTTNDNATAGDVGEFVDSGVSGTSAATTTTNINVTSISLTAGDWDVGGTVEFNPNAATMTAFTLSPSSTSVTLLVLGTLGRVTQQFSTTLVQQFTSGMVRFSLAGNATIYLVANVVYTGTGVNVSGQITARRAR